MRASCSCACVNNAGHLCRRRVSRVCDEQERDRHRVCDRDDRKKSKRAKGCSKEYLPPCAPRDTTIVMHHYRSREEETSCGADPYFYLRLSAGSVPYNPIKLEVDVKPEPRISPVTCLQQQQQQQPHPQLHHQQRHHQQGSPSDAAVMDITGSGGGGSIGIVCKNEEEGTTGIGLLALTQLDGYGEYKSESPYGDGTGVITSVDLHDRIGNGGDNNDDDKVHKYSFGRLIYSSPDDIKHQVFEVFLFLSLSLLSLS